ncbi:hypothetical protein D9758_000087 [Tetrapyrgos nigripes]|uniref:Uncharacterized protein n=1 Tax=Tetrapyrgos nigripes TaxID=182062 RepID=A0A8H5H218_9AGAR|nr:hypothetical protein D9758_000087 [Tetrapyrgos nigripes]
MSFLKRSRCHLTTLCVKNLPLQDVDLITLLQHFPSLTSLTIHEIDLQGEPGSGTQEIGFPSTSHFFDSLTVKHMASTSTLLPHLKELDLRYNRRSFPTLAAV